MTTRALFASLLLSACCSCPPPKEPAAPVATAAPELLVQVVRLEHTPAQSGARVLKDTFGNRRSDGSDLRIAIHAEQNALVLSGTAAQIQQALELIARLDTAAPR